MPTVYATCGLSFSGKTTLAKRVSDLLIIPRISLDEINSSRGLNGGEDMTDAQWEETSLIATEKLRHFVVSGQSLVLDDTLSHRFLRDRYRETATEAGADFILLFVDTKLSVIAERIRQNRVQPVRGDIKNSVFEVHQDRFQRPTKEEKPLHLVSNSDIEMFIGSLRADNK